MDVEHLSPSLVGPQVEAWRRDGGRVVGYACLLTPVEVLDAAGLFPYRVKALGASRTDLADARLSRFNCGFCRSCLQLALEGSFDVLDGLIETNGCDQLRGMFENWQHAAPARWFHYLKVPHVVTPEALEYFALELRRLVAALERGFDVEISDDRLVTAIERQERVREKLLRLSALRERPRPAVSGAEALALVVAGGSLTPAAFDDALGEALARYERRGEGAAPRRRVLLGGAATDELDLVRDVEDLGGAVVIDTLCFGARALPAPGAALPAGWRDDPIRALAERTLRGATCPRMYDDFPRRLALVLDGVRRAAVDGVVLVHNTFCDLHGIDNALLRLELEARGVPVLAIEKAYGAAADRGRVRTRVQAFLERIGGGR
jgi:benzoyl-CoA reductase/2-hydroxyglutaryl-CoA dehydratase subunit BcrC/BadD/HgdB